MQLWTFQRRAEKRAVFAALMMFVVGLFTALVGAAQAQACQRSAVVHGATVHSVQMNFVPSADRAANRAIEGARSDRRRSGAGQDATSHKSRGHDRGDGPNSAGWLHRQRNDLCRRTRARRSGFGLRSGRCSWPGVLREITFAAASRGVPRMHMPVWPGHSCHEPLYCSLAIQVLGHGLCCRPDRWPVDPVRQAAETRHAGFRRHGVNPPAPALPH